MRIADVMTRDVRVVQPDRTVRDAARLMDELNVGALPVCDGRRLIGMITDRDITVRAVAAGLSPGETAVEEVMSADVSWCFDDDDVDDVVETMSRRQIRRIPVVDRGKRLVGIVALGDLATDQEEDAGRALRRISTPSEPDRSGTQSVRRADRTRDRRPARLTGDERRELDERLSNAARSRRAGSRPTRFEGDRDEGMYSRGLAFREADHVRAAFGSFGHPGEERARNAVMRGGFGGEGYGSYGEDYRRRDEGFYGGGFPNRRFGRARLTGEWEQPGDDSRPEESRAQHVERAYSLAYGKPDRSNYGVGPGNTRFGNDATASRGENRGRGPRNYQRSDDRIREDIADRLTDDALIDASEIEVTVEGREVTLSGSVRDRHERRRVEDIAESVAGVTHVQNNLRVGQHQPGHPSGTEIGDSGVATGNPGLGTAATGGRS
jgi:osmotically-inducible protein OsmY/CBS domain-containing protein